MRWSFCLSLGAEHQATTPVSCRGGTEEGWGAAGSAGFYCGGLGAGVGLRRDGELQAALGFTVVALGMSPHAGSLEGGTAPGGPFTWAALWITHWVDSRESSLLRRLERGREIGL